MENAYSKSIGLRSNANSNVLLPAGAWGNSEDTLSAPGTAYYLELTIEYICNNL